MASGLWVAQAPITPPEMPRAANRVSQVGGGRCGQERAMYLVEGRFPFIFGLIVIFYHARVTPKLGEVSSVWAKQELFSGPLLTGPYC